jgi:cobalamin biosynthesis Mg chelatase CobN
VTAEAQFKALVDALLAESEASYGNDETKAARRMFASTSIKTRGKMFAFLRPGRHK